MVNGKTEKKLRCVGGLIMNGSDGTWLKPNARTVCYPEFQAAYVLVDEVLEANCLSCLVN